MAHSKAHAKHLKKNKDFFKGSKIVSRFPLILSPKQAESYEKALKEYVESKSIV